MAQINKPNTYFNTKLYTGTGSTQSITGVGFQPDLVWTKQRNGTASHGWTDSVRGLDKYLSSEQNIAEYSLSNNGLSSFDSDGFTVVSHAMYNGSSYTYTSWNWLADNTSGSSNTDGSITSTVAKNTTSGFSIVSYTGTGANATVGHGLGVAPKMIILKSRTDSGADWRVYHASVGNTGYLELNTTGATTTSSTTWQNTTPTSTVFSIGTSGTVNLNTGNFIAYCFAEKKGFSKFGSYTGNGSTNGTFVYTGFKPAMLITKRTDSATNGSWQIYDNKRDVNNVAGVTLRPNSADSESTIGTYALDFLSNGFKLRGTNTHNDSGASYIYMAFAENPLVGTNNIPATAR